jgi:RNA polymerase sigma-70 factor (ECF subfamily)
MSDCQAPDPRSWTVGETKKDGTAFASALDAYERPIYGYLRRMLGDAEEAQDLTQEVFLRLWRNGFPKRASVRTWLFQLARNLFVDRLRRRRPNPFGLDGVELEDPAPRPLERLEIREERERARNALENLPQPYRDVAVLRFQEGFTLKDIARISHLRRNTVAVRLVRARQLLRKAMTPPRQPIPTSQSKEAKDDELE